MEVFKYLRRLTRDVKSLLVSRKYFVRIVRSRSTESIYVYGTRKEESVRVRISGHRPSSGFEQIDVAIHPRGETLDDLIDFLTVARSGSKLPSRIAETSVFAKVTSRLPSKISCR
jgi:hypothetical protein